MSTNFRGLQERLRDRLLMQIAAGELTGQELSRQTGYQQAHISNFLNRKRNMSLEAMDLLLGAAGLTLETLMAMTGPVHTLHAQAATSGSQFVSIPIIEGENLHATEVPNSEWFDVVKVAPEELQKIPEKMAVPRPHWTRFIATNLSDDDARAMSPRLAPGSIIVIDRHYNSLEPWRPREPNIYLVRTEDGHMVRYVEQAASHLVLRPESIGEPLRAVPAKGGQDPRAAIIGRVCMVQAWL